jgi:hypothetical protein
MKRLMLSAAVSYGRITTARDPKQAKVGERKPEPLALPNGSFFIHS